MVPLDPGQAPGIAPNYPLWVPLDPRQPQGIAPNYPLWVPLDPGQPQGIAPTDFADEIIAMMHDSSTHPPRYPDTL